MSEPRLISRAARVHARDMFWLAYDAHERCVFETAAAEVEGREFTRVYWYYPEDWGVPVLTLWDMNDESPEVALNKRYYIHAQL